MHEQMGAAAVRVGTRVGQMLVDQGTEVEGFGLLHRLSLRVADRYPQPCAYRPPRNSGPPAGVDSRRRPRGRHVAAPGRRSPAPDQEASTTGGGGVHLRLAETAEDRP
ncbi:hypothetical protein GCM10017752_02580 [Streptomyces roseoviridis]